LQKAVAAENRTYGVALLSLFKAAYFMVNETIPFQKFPTLHDLLVSYSAHMTETYIMMKRHVMRWYLGFQVLSKDKS
jgi:hypothetical protein